MDALPWRRINAFLLDIGGAQTEGDFNRRLWDGIDALVPADSGAASFLFEGDGVHWLDCTPGLERAGNEFNAHYRSLCSVSPAYARMHAVTDFSPWEDTEYVTDFIRPTGIHSALGGFDGKYHVSLYRSKRAPSFSEGDHAILKVLLPHISNVYRHVHALAALPQRDRPAGEPEIDCRLLTRREAQIAQLLALRMSAREIGSALGTSHRTVERHIQNMYEKLDVSRRADLVRKLSPSSVDPHRCKTG